MRSDSGSILRVKSHYARNLTGSSVIIGSVPDESQHVCIAQTSHVARPVVDGAEETSRATGPDGKIMHAELKIGNSRVMVNDAMMGGKGPKACGGSPASFRIYVEDCEALFNRAVAAGAQTLDGPMGKVSDQFWGDRAGPFKDPVGYQWTIATHKEDLTPEEMKQRQDAFMKQMAQQPQPTHA